MGIYSRSVEITDFPPWPYVYVFDHRHNAMSSLRTMDSSPGQNNPGHSALSQSISTSKILFSLHNATSYWLTEPNLGNSTKVSQWLLMSSNDSLWRQVVSNHYDFPMTSFHSLKRMKRTNKIKLTSGCNRSHQKSSWLDTQACLYTGDVKMTNENSHDGWT